MSEEPIHAERIFRVTASALYLRNQPSRTAQSLALLPHRQAVARLDESEWDGWWWVFADVPGQGVFDGYAYSEYLEPIDEPEVVQAEPIPVEKIEPTPSGDMPRAEVPEALAPHVLFRPNGTIKQLSMGQIRQHFGKFDYEDDPNQTGAVKILGGWDQENIVAAGIPALAHVGYGKLWLHKKAVAPFQRAFARIAEAGLTKVILTCAGSFVPRHKTWDPDRSLSSHSWGLAIDINAQWNGYGKVPPAIGKHGSVREIVPYFIQEGIAWGGDFTSPDYDGMHFELARMDL